MGDTASGGGDDNGRHRVLKWSWLLVVATGLLVALISWQVTRLSGLLAGELPFFAGTFALSVFVIYVFYKRSQSLRTIQTARSIIDALPLATIVVDANDRVLDCNKAVGDLLGITASVPLHGRTIMSLFSEQHGAAIKSLLNQATSGSIATLEMQLNDIDNTTKLLSLRASSLDSLGKHAAAKLISVQDVTKQKRIDQSRQGQLRIMEMIATGAPMEFTLDQLLRLVEAQVSDMRCSLLLLEPDGKHLRCVAAPSLPKILMDEMSMVEIGPTVGSCGTAAFFGKNVYVADIDNDPLWAGYEYLAKPYGLRACWSTPLFDQYMNVMGTFAIYYPKVGLPTPDHVELIASTTHLATVCIDQHRAAQALRDSEERFREVVENIDEVFWVRDARTNQFLYISPGFEKIWGQSWRGYDSSLEFLLESVIAEDRQRVQVAMLAPIVGSKSETLEFQIMRPDQSRRWISARRFPIFDEQGEIYRVAGVVQDVTAAKAMAEQMRQAQKLEAIGALAGGIAHDFNNIISIINGNAELALRDVDPCHPAANALDQILKAGLRARSVVQQILLFNRADGNARQVIELPPVIDEVRRLLRATLPAEVDLVMQIDEKLPAVLADATQIHQVLLNLCTNAWHAQDKRIGRIQVGLRRKSVAEPLQLSDILLPVGEYVCLTVQDNGRGIDAATRQRMFEPFFTTKPPGKGTGLGLLVVQSIVRSHDAWLSVDSVLGMGTTVSIYFPVATQPAAIKSEVSVQPIVGHGEHILYLDDEDTLVTLMTRMLQRQGYVVHGFVNPIHGLDAFLADPGMYDLVVTDYNMTGINGLEIAARIRDCRCNVPVLLTSGFVTEELQAQARAAGVTQVIYKPSTLQEFGVLIHEVLRQRHEQRQQTVVSGPIITNAAKSPSLIPATN